MAKQQQLISGNRPVSDTFLIGLLLLALALLMLPHPRAQTQALPTELISITSQQQSANAASELSAATPDLSHLVFVSAATDLAGNVADAGQQTNVYVRNRLAATTARVSRALSGSPDGPSFSGDISDDGSQVVFASDATNLTLFDTNGVTDIFAHNLSSGQTTLLSTNLFDTPSNGTSITPVISGNGRHVLFASLAANLDQGSGISRPIYDLFVLDRDSDADQVLDEAGALEPKRVVQIENGQVADPQFRGFDISSNGRFVVFVTNFRGLTPEPLSATYNLYFHDRDPDRNGVFDEPGSVTTTLLSKSAAGEAFTEDSGSPALSSDGSRVLVATTASQLEADCLLPGFCSFYVLALPADATSGDPDPSAAAVVYSNRGTVPRLSAAGDSITFVQETGNLVTRSIDTDTSVDVCVSQFLRKGNNGCSFGIAANGGQRTYFESSSSNLAPLDVNAVSDVWVFDANGTAPASPQQPACDDQTDNDGNGLIDMADPGCFAPEDNDEMPGEPLSLSEVINTTSPSGAFVRLDSRGLKAQFPSISPGSRGDRYTAYTVERYLPIDPLDPAPVSELISEVLLSRFNYFHKTVESIGRGKYPKLQVDTANNLHAMQPHGCP